MDDVDSPVRPRRQRAMNSFQMEIKSKLRERRAKGLSAEITSEESADDDVDDTMEFGTLRRQDRPPSAKRRGDHASSTWHPGLGDTMRTQDIERLMGRRTPNFDEEDSEISSALSNKHSAGGLGLSQRKTPTPKEGGLFGRKTPTSPQQLSKEDIIFGRKTPTQQRGGKSPQGGASDLPNLGGQQPWQPPSFRNVSPSSEQRASPGSQGRLTPGLDSMLDPISERQEGQRTPRMARDHRGDHRGLSTEKSPRDSDKPVPRSRGKKGEKEAERPARTTPTLDLFGKSRRDNSHEVEKELKEIDDRKDIEERLQRRAAERKSPIGRKTPTGTKSPGPAGRKSPGPGRRFSPTREGRKSPGDGMLGRDKPQKEKEPSSLLDFLTGEVSDKPKAKDKDRGDPRTPARRSKIPKDEHRDIYDIGEVPSDMPRAPPPQGRGFREDSSVCEDLTEDPTAASRRMLDDHGDGRRATQRSDRQKADDAINKIAQEQSRIDFKPVKKVRPVSASAKVQHRPKPRYGTTLPGQTSKEQSMPEYHSTLDIRDAVYEDWYRKHIKAAKVDKLEKEKKEEEEAKKKKQQEEEKKTEAMLAFKAWEERKKEDLAKAKARKIKEEEKKREKEQQERKDKQVEAEVTFKSWKEKKDEWLKDKLKEEKRKEREKMEKVHEEKMNKEKDNMTAFSGWKSKKDVVIKHKVKEQKKKKVEEETTLLATQKQKEEEAQQRYEDWLYNKEKQDHRKQIEAKRRDMTGEMDYRPPFRPANHTVPFGR